MAPELEVQTVAPDSKPGLPSRLAPLGGGSVGGVVPPHVADPAGRVMALNAASTLLQV